MDKLQPNLILKHPQIYQTLSEVIPCGLYMVDERGRICHWNAGAEAITGLDRGQVIGRPCAQVLPCPNRQSLCPLHPPHTTTAHGAGIQIEMEVAGRRLHLYKNVRYLFEPDGGISGSIESFVDLTREHEAEAVLREARDLVDSARQAKRHFMANMSHEIRTPLNGIMGLLDLLLNDAPTARQQEHLLMARRSTDLLLNLVGDILDFTVINKGALQIEETGFSLRSVMASLITRQHDLTQNKLVCIHSHVADEVPDNLLGDPGRLYQILKHLVGNAIKFTPAGEVTVAVNQAESGACSIENGQRRIRLHFSVCDTGVGIPKDKCEDIFEAFSQADDSSTRLFGGLGIGLHTVHRLVDLLDGHIRVESQLGQGTAVHFELPFRRAYDGAPQPAEASGAAAGDREKPTAMPPRSLPSPAQGRLAEGIDLYEAPEPTMNHCLPSCEQLRGLLDSDLAQAETLVGQARQAASAAGQKNLAAALLRLLLAVRRNDAPVFERCMVQLEQELAVGHGPGRTAEDLGENHENIDCGR